MTRGAAGTAATPIQPPSPLRYVLVGILVPALLAVLVVWLRSEYRRSEILREEAVRSLDRRIDQITLLSHLKDAETAQRGFLLTGDQRFIASYEPTRRTIYAQLRAAHSTGPTFVKAYIDMISELVDAKFAELDRTIALSRVGDTAGARALVETGEGIRIMDSLRMRIERMIVAEETRSNRERDAFVAYREWLQKVVYAVVGVTILIVLVSLWLIWRMRRERHTSLVAAVEAGERHATILDSTIDAILILNPSGTIETVNAAAMRMLGYRPHELIRRDIATVLDLAPGEGSFYQRIGLQGMRLRRSFLPDRTVRHRGGHPVAVDVAIGVMGVPSGVHLVVSLRDIAERKRVDRVKDELISTVSHELRTPLTSVVGSLGLLGAGAAGTLPSDAARLVQIAESNSRRLIRLINDMLDVDRIESGKLVLERVPFDLREVVDRACLGSEGLALAETIKLSCVAGERPVIVIGDSDRLLQVVTNLLSNAIRAAPSDTAVDIALNTDAESAYLWVADRGPGVPLGFRDRIFGRFERADQDDGAVGTGLGLAISREIVERHGGAIWFEDRDGGGTRFVFSVPLAPTGAKPEEDVIPVLQVASSGTPDAATAQGDDRLPLILHVDDDRDLLDVVAAGIAREAHMLAATDLAGARAILKTVSPDVAILDVNLADGSGLDLLPLLVDADGRDIPTIIYTAHDVPPEQARGAKAVLVKTRGTIPHLVAEVRRVLRSEAIAT